MRNTCHMLIGPPCSGKSTWREQHLNSVAVEPVIVSSDDYIERLAESLGVSYSAAMAKSDRKDIDRRVRDDFLDAILNGRNIVVDRTNMGAKARNKFLANLPRSYDRIAVLFEVPRDVLNVRLQARAAATGKFIPPSVVDDMLARYNEPTIGEFNSIIRVPRFDL